MPCQSKIAELLPCGYGFVVLTATGSVFVNIWLALRVGQARKKYGVELPRLYGDDDKKVFNCIQRAHQHTLENYPHFLLFLLIGGLQLPKLSAAAGVVYLAGRIVAAKGYSTGEPEKRKYGAFGMVGLLVLLGNTLCFAFHQLDWNPLKQIKS